MATEVVQIVIDKQLLRATDRVAQQRKQNRSALVRDALRKHLRRLSVRAMEESRPRRIRQAPSIVRRIQRVGAGGGVAGRMPDYEY